MSRPPSLTVLIPCHNEQSSIAAVIAEHQAEFPDARIVVVDNASTDNTAEIARSLGATVIYEPRKGKARGVITALPYIDTELMLMVDGDASYPAAGGRILVEHWRKTGADMITGLREPVETEGEAIFRPMHQAGTRVFGELVRTLFGVEALDVFSGLRLFTRRFYTHVPILHPGFELEMELTVQAVDKGFLVSEIRVPFGARWEGTASKLSTLRDGTRILRALLVLFRDYQPLRFFAVLAACAFTAGLTAGYFPIAEYVRTGLVYRLPLAVLAASLMIIGVLTAYAGVILESGLRSSRESFQIMLRRWDADHADHGRPISRD